jgi:hypothetical protein
MRVCCSGYWWNAAQGREDLDSTVQVVQQSIGFAKPVWIVLQAKKAPLGSFSRKRLRRLCRM